MRAFSRSGVTPTTLAWPAARQRSQGGQRQASCWNSQAGSTAAGDHTPPRTIPHTSSPIWEQHRDWQQSFLPAPTNANRYLPTSSDRNGNRIKAGGFLNVILQMTSYIQSLIIEKLNWLYLGNSAQVSKIFQVSKKNNWGWHHRYNYTSYPFELVNRKWLMHNQ